MTTADQALCGQPTTQGTPCVLTAGHDEPNIHHAAPNRGEFCHRHFSWLCQAGQGKCQTEATPATEQLRDILDNGVRTLPGPTTLAALIEVASEDDKVALFMKISDVFGQENTTALWFHAEGVRSAQAVDLARAAGTR